jgi:hypothetical protein
MVKPGERGGHAKQAWDDQSRPRGRGSQKSGLRYMLSQCGRFCSKKSNGKESKNRLTYKRLQERTERWNRYSDNHNRGDCARALAT